MKICVCVSRGVAAAAEPGLLGKTGPLGRRCSGGVPRFKRTKAFLNFIFFSITRHSAATQQTRLKSLERKRSLRYTRRKSCCDIHGRSPGIKSRPPASPAVAQLLARITSVVGPAPVGQQEEVDGTGVSANLVSLGESAFALIDVIPPKIDK